MPRYDAFVQRSHGAVPAGGEVGAAAGEYQEVWGPSGGGGFWGGHRSWRERGPDTLTPMSASTYTPTHFGTPQQQRNEETRLDGTRRIRRNRQPLAARESGTVVATVTPGKFIAKWRASELKERSAAQEHFIDLCRLLGEPTPAEADPTGEHYCFERGARKDTGGDGWADVWKRYCFAWEYKGKHADLGAAFNQLRQYALALENPPLLIVSDMVRFRIRTNWTNSVSLTHEFTLEDLADAANREKLKWAMAEPERLRPGESRQALTERAAATFAELAQSASRAGSRGPGGRALRQSAGLLHVR